MSGIVVSKLLAKKFQSPGWPSTRYIDTRLAESTPSLKNLRPIPGPSLVSGVGSVADESLIRPRSAPLKIPVYGLPDEGLNFTLPTTPTEWMYFYLVPQK